MTQYTDLENSKAVVVPSKNSKISVPELNPPVFTLCRGSNTNNVVTIDEVQNGKFAVFHQPTKLDSWTQVSIENNIQSAIRKAAQIQNFGLEVVEDELTGLQNIFFNGSEDGGIVVDSEQHFPLHVVKTEPNRMRKWEYRIETPAQHGGPTKTGYILKSRSTNNPDWSTTHCIESDIQPSTALLQLAKITDMNVWVPGMDQSLEEYANSTQENETPALPTGIRKQ